MGIILRYLYVGYLQRSQYFLGLLFTFYLPQPCPEQPWAP